ncbi:late control D domain protein, partial [Escherichia coli 2854350]
MPHREGKMTDTTMQLLSQSTDPVKMPDFDIL